MKSAPKRRAIDRRAVHWLAAAAVLLLGAGGYLVLRSDRVAARLVSPGERIVAAAGPTDLRLPDGTRLVLSRGSTLSVIEASASSATRLRVDRGEVRFDVPQRAGRDFVVEARDVRAVVRGTRFVVLVHEGVETEIQVSVEVGRVEMQDRKGHVLGTLSPNQTWSMYVVPDQVPAP